MKQREIKFRAWHKVDKEMKPVNSLKSIYTDSVRLSESEYHDLIIMQYTGLKDKNGVEIYEGDIVSIYGGQNCVIEWRQDRTKYDFKYKVKLMIPQWMGGIDKDYAKRELEVIGNIYENPELLEK